MLKFHRFFITLIITVMSVETANLCAVIDSTLIAGTIALLYLQRQGFHRRFNRSIGLQSQCQLTSIAIANVFSASQYVGIMFSSTKLTGKECTTESLYVVLLYKPS